MNNPLLIVVSGLPGSGKSTLAESLAKKLSIPVFSVDPIESSVIKSGISQSFETGLAAYIVAEKLADEQLKLGISVIIDAVSPVEEARNMWRKLSEKHNAKLVIIECVVNEKIHKDRIKSRVRTMHGIPEVTWEDVEKRKKEYLPWDEERLIIDTSNDTQSSLLEAIILRERTAQDAGARLIFCDRGVVDPAAYIRAYGHRELSARLMDQMAHWIKTYNGIYLLDPKGIPYQTDNVRTETAEERMRLHQSFVDLFDEFRVRHVLLSGGVDERMAQINADLNVLTRQTLELVIGH